MPNFKIQNFSKCPLNYGLKARETLCSFFGLLHSQRVATFASWRTFILGLWADSPSDFFRFTFSFPKSARWKQEGILYPFSALQETLAGTFCNHCALVPDRGAITHTE